MTVMDDAELCKSDGNTFFSSGDVPAAINSYRRGLDILRTSSTKDDDAINALRLSLYSNLANAYLSSCDYDASCEAAEQAMAIDPSAIKPAIRWVEARRRSGFSFEALVHDLLRLRPLLRTAVARGAITIKEATTLRMQVEEPLFAAVGLVNVSDGFELIQHAGGVAMVSQRTFGPNEVLFCEKKYRTSFDASLDLEADCTTERIAARFATRLRPEQKQQSEEWRTFRDQFRGAWPRSADEVDEETKTMVGAHLRRELPDLNDDDLQELLLASLMCRYNCFHSGFFRTCALANHSCHANIAMKYNPNEETVTMITVRDIKPGDLMNVKYLNDAHFLMGLGHRREFLRSWLFWCGCDRCVADAAPTAVQEQVVCARCGRCTHYPLFMPNTEQHTDPMKKSEEGACCQHCHERVEWSDERDALARQIASSLLQNSQHASPGQLTAWIRVQLKLLGSVQLHPAHWLYRVLFYFSCVPLTSMIDGCTARFTPTCTSGELTELFESCGLAEHYLPRLEKMIAAESESSDRSTASLLWVNEPILHNIAAGPAPEGCDALRVLELLWHFISSFYPPYEMWAIHRAVCQLVLLRLVSRHGAGRTVPLTNHTALLLLERHGPYVGDVDARRWMHLFTQHRKAAEAVGPLPPLAKLKKAFRLK